MKTHVIATVVATVCLIGMDAAWLTATLKNFYKPRIGHLMAENANFAAAGGFYVVFLLGLMALVVFPILGSGGSLGRAALMGAIFGLAAYGTYDFTNQATLRDWPVVVTLVDLAWGAAMTAVVATVSVAAARYFA